MKDVVLEVFELLVRGLRTFQIDLGMRQKQALPAFGVRILEEAQCIERQLMMRAVGVRGIDDAEKKVHGAVPGGASSNKVIQRTNIWARP